MRERLQPRFYGHKNLSFSYRLFVTLWLVYSDVIDRNKSDTSLSSVSSKMNILSSSPLRCVPIMEKTNEKKHRQHRQVNICKLPHYFFDTQQQSASVKSDNTSFHTEQTF